jgi:MFS family permease
MGTHPGALATTISKATWRLVPFLLLMYILAFLDRANVGFAKESFQLDTGISEAAYAFGAGVFFAGYALLEVPSNLIMHRVGARVWMARIMVTWGLVSAAMMFAHTATTFYVLRLLLGIAEAGFFPGVILYLTYWFPSYARAKVLGLFYFGAPLAFILGGPISGLLLDMDGVLGLQGWQWMFMVEGLLAAATGVWAYFYIDDKPADAVWLDSEEKRVLNAAVAAEDRDKRVHGPHGVLAGLSNRGVLYLSAIYFLIQVAVYGVVFYLPTQVAQLLGKKVGLEVGLVTAIPWMCALIAAYLIPQYSDRTGERRWTAAFTLAVAGAGIAVSAASGSPMLALGALCVAASGFIAVQPLFWTFPTGYLSGAAAAGGIALVNSFGAAGGFAGPIVRTWAEQSFGLPLAGLHVLALAAFIGAILIAIIGMMLPGVDGNPPRS